MSATRKELNGQKHTGAGIKDLIASAQEIRLTDVAGPLDNLDEKFAADPECALNEAEKIVEELQKRSPLEQERTLAHPAFHKRRTFFRQMLKSQEKPKEIDGQGRPMSFPDDELEPDPNPVNLAHLLDCISESATAHAILPDGASDILAVWIALTYCFQKFDMKPHLLINSPEPQCGKSVTLDWLTLLVRRPREAMGITGPVLFRATELYGPTWLLDEADRGLFDQDGAIAIVNASHKRNGKISRNVGDNHEPRDFSVYTPIVIAGIGDFFPDTVESRCIKITMKRALPEERARRRRIDRLARIEATRLKRKLMRWAQDLPDELPECHEELPYRIAGDDDRRADNYRPMLTITEAAGNGWTDRLIAAGQALNASRKVLGGIHNALLQSVRIITQREAHLGKEFISTTEIISDLVQMEDQPWSNMPRSHKEINPREFWSLLKRYGLESTQFRNAAGKTPLGLRIKDCEEAFARYLDAPAAAGGAGSNGAFGSQKNKNFNSVQDLQHDQPISGAEYERLRKLMHEKRRPLAELRAAHGARVTQ